MSASAWSLVATVSEVLADLSGTLGKHVWRELPDSELVRRTSARDLGSVNGVSEDSRAGEESAPWQSYVEVLPAHDAENISSNKA